MMGWDQFLGSCIADSSGFLLCLQTVRSGHRTGRSPERIPLRVTDSTLWIEQPADRLKYMKTLLSLLVAAVLCMGGGGCDNDDSSVSSEPVQDLTSNDTVTAADEDIPTVPCLNVAGRWSGESQCFYSDVVEGVAITHTDTTPIGFTLEQDGCSVLGNGDNDERVSGIVDGSFLSVQVSDIWGTVTYAGTLDTRGSVWSLDGSGGNCIWTISHSTDD